MRLVELACAALALLIALCALTLPVLAALALVKYLFL